jgi:hypothetical protein
MFRFGVSSGGVRLFAGRHREASPQRWSLKSLFKNWL